MGRAIQLHKLYQKIGHSIQLHTAAKETTTMFPYFFVFTAACFAPKFRRESVLSR